MNETPTANTPSLDDLALFLDVARAGSLSEAAKRTGTPLPTLSRRMAKLEQTTGRTLFLRGKTGYALSAEGRDLAERIGELSSLKRAATLWASTAHGPVPVTITAGFWTARHIARHLSPDPKGLWRPAFAPSNAALDIARREADIGIRNKPPESTRLARQPLRRIDYAIYAISGAINGYVALPDGVPSTPSQRWLRSEHGAEITTTATDPRLCLDLARNGFGRIILPTFAGDGERGLRRLSDPIPGLSHEEWLVSHNEARHDPPIRAALTAVASALRAKPD
jgi:DNA-binding transcriptional LysR family regulator